MLALRVLIIPAIKKRMEKYINEVGKTARNASEKLQVITIDVILNLLQHFPILLFVSLWYEELLHIDGFFLSPEFTP